ncbi:MAG TPA: tyrosine--tRNA ligase [Hungateiclostridium thermocellum]|uniref:Tyrosine--tRNA ligase n=2 Tax=Acetivibrio thermocellus TaxID=1515 RepID=SYY_ACET2|nr:tyrosine--tRNA ligase [Acetivibrio thermocellus]A3DDC9.1 RecName: Full=Tyrosine--tRNA ligase; AltName: Full=Tyrosyl-tRNA synthetase; Short=TyrRS [Acetivibrio thermocellus ATCC 27405]CDG35416.1 Tyrosine-tRNA ligase [Acetivibrio thermocellus BC1]ABN51958.1 tyrosyl-tRNA synthetase [Acetivibrio thermocellus ATCC 27405]ADU74562.1 tyrosyl-tRNA synthetase [Acetivibrio thermocellus DSM 1313]ALX08506.1 Tyrosyl-tRNA synthetase [Acetivibrio thermocellus AD2]ANV76255.1 Tyrosyl-tRNA synthetase [Acetivi
MSSVFETLKERGYIAQLTHEEKIKELLEKEKITFYIGFDPTADSLHVGHFLQMMVMAHMQKAGHRPIALIGGGTAMVGDPTGRTDMRKMMTREEIKHNADCFKKQLSKFIEFGEGKAIMVDNADWLLDLNYIEFLRDIGVHFSVNRMLTAECFKSRLERGLSFIEFNYMLMQSYDFLKLYKEYGCIMQLGGDDQWSNILGGIDLIRRKEGKEVYGMTFTLLTTSEGKKMGKTEKGALWLDANKTSPYEFYQYWRNIHDADVIKCLKLLTFVPMEEIEEYAKLKDQEINIAKKRLAFEVTKLIHGEEEALNAQKTAEALFEKGASTDNMPTTEVASGELSNGINIIDLLLKTKLIPSKGEGRRLIEQGGISVNDVRVEGFDRLVTMDDFNNGELIIKKGKKTYHRVKLV